MSLREKIKVKILKNQTLCLVQIPILIPNIRKYMDIYEHKKQHKTSNSLKTLRFFNTNQIG